MRCFLYHCSRVLQGIPILILMLQIQSSPLTPHPSPLTKQVLGSREIVSFATMFEKLYLCTHQEREYLLCLMKYLQARTIFGSFTIHVDPIGPDTLWFWRTRVVLTNSKLNLVPSLMNSSHYNCSTILFRFYLTYKILN